MAEEYNSPQSPYWALKFFLPLALPQGHPFWQAEEEDLPALDAVRPQPHPGVLVCRDDARGHVFILSGRQTATWPNHGPEKYAKFAYSTAFGFSVPVGHGDLSKGAFDSVLALADDPEHFRPRERSRDCRVGGDALFSRWRPWPDVEVETWLLPALPWHVRVHRVRTGRHLWSAEGGWALDRTGDDGQDRAGTGHGVAVDVGGALSLFPAGASGIRDLLGARTGEVVRAAPNTNLLHPRTVIPTLRGELAPGEHLLACAVLGLPGTGAGEVRAVWESPPRVSLEKGALGLTHGGKAIRLALGASP
ncbi:hypothetical protein DAERI_070062 [Deinococcus aerius]|uniref:Uncharacterized protein n=1 Tax=Deinococcus aerius TaxID=200253 RepID=A0A2I9CVS6_9DEIO|nr:hypothetical protein DAERI_070062 [Deinococcus aerius]